MKGDARVLEKLGVGKATEYLTDVKSLLSAHVDDSTDFDMKIVVDYLNKQSMSFVADLTGIHVHKLYSIKSGKCHVRQLSVSQYRSIMYLIELMRKDDGTYRIFKKTHGGRYIGEGDYYEV